MRGIAYFGFKFNSHNKKSAKRVPRFAYKDFHAGEGRVIWAGKGRVTWVRERGRLGIPFPVVVDFPSLLKLPNHILPLLTPSLPCHSVPGSSAISKLPCFALPKLPCPILLGLHCPLTPNQDYPAIPCQGYPALPCRDYPDYSPPAQTILLCPV